MAVFAREYLKELVEDGTEVEVEETISFVHDEVLKVADGEALGVFEVVDEAAWSCDYYLEEPQHSNG